MKQLFISAYKVYWAEFTPVKGTFVTKHDNMVISGTRFNLGSFQRNVRKHFVTKDDAIKFIRTFDKKLDKKYMVRLFTDKQFGMAKEGDGYAIPYTQKQLNEVYYIG